MQGTGLKEQINRLIELQALDSQIYALKDEKNARPDQIKKLEILIEEKKNGLASSEKKLQDLLKEKKDKELELASKEEIIKKLQTQLYQLKTNKEYSAMLREIGGVKADVSLFEDKILEALDKIDREKINIEQEKQIFVEEEKKSKEEINKIQMRIKEIEGFLAQLEAQRNVQTSDIEPKILRLYEKVLQNRDGLAIVKVSNDACQGCNMSVPPQVINLIKMWDQIVSCEICQRILYLDEQE
jgi:predicted  nucleic acid-binding Zn-ribbon protein